MAAIIVVSLATKVDKAQVDDLFKRAAAHDIDQKPADGSAE